MHLVEQILKEYYGSLGAGILPICTTTNRILVGLRSSNVNSPNTWGTFGGKVEGDDNNLKDVALREFQEEAGYSGPIKLIPAYVFRDGEFTYHNFIGLVEKEFTPSLDWETDEAIWFTFEEVLNIPNKHFGLELLLNNSFNIIKKYVGVEILTEKMITPSQTGDRFVSIINKMLSERSDATVNINFSEEEVLVELDLRDFGKVDKVLQIAKILGWFPSFQTLWRPGDREDTKFDINVLKRTLTNWEKIVISFEKEYGDKIDLPKYIYHVIPEERYKKVAQQGLNPKTHSKKTAHPERIYFGTQVDKMEKLADMLYDRETNKDAIKGTYKLLQIDTSKLPKDIEFFPDPDYPDGIFTYTSIRPNFIKVIKTIQLGQANKEMSDKDLEDLLNRILRARASAS